MTLDPSTADSPRKGCIVFDSDSQYFACRNLVPYFLAAGWTLDFVVVGLFKPPGPPIDGVKIVRVLAVPELWRLREVLEADAIGAYLPGSKLRHVWEGVNAMFLKTAKRPLLFTGYNGLVLKAFEDGFAWRAGYDLIALNSPEDHEKAASFADHSTVPRTALMPIIGMDRTNKPSVQNPETQPPGSVRAKQIVFAEQVLFPRDRREKFYLYSHFIRIALANPEWRIVVKPRTMPGGETFHRQEEHVSKFIERHFILPPNVVVSYDPLDQILKESTVLFSISSTAFFDALGQGIPAFSLSDFGITSNYGTQFFHGSGCTLCLGEITTLSQEMFDRRPADEWLEFKGFSPAFSPVAIVEGLDRLLAEGVRLSPLAPVDMEQRLMGAEADLPGEFITPRVKRLRYFGKSPMDPERRTGVSWRKSLARFRRGVIGLAKDGFNPSGADGSSSNRA